MRRITAITISNDSHAACHLQLGRVEMLAEAVFTDVVDFRRACAFDPAQPMRIEAYVLGTLIECFVNDRHAFTARAYTHPAGGALSFAADGGSATVRGLRVQVAP